MTKTEIHSFESILQNLPKKILHNRCNDAVAECVLYDISRDICLNFVEVAYFIYNPDFHVCKGMAGINRKEIDSWQDDPWQNITNFQNIVKNTDYNKKIKKTEFCTTISNNDLQAIINEIKKSIEMEYASIHHWNLQNNNTGILLYHCNDTTQNRQSSEIENAAILLSFCPIC